MVTAEALGRPVRCRAVNPLASVGVSPVDVPATPMDLPLSLPVALDRSSPEPLYRQVERQLRAAIEAGHLRPGDRVVSVRELARELDVGRLTVATAYEHLAADGYLVGRVGFGTIVASTAPTAAAAN